MRKLLTFIFAILFAMPCFADIGATNGVANSATCDSGALDTDSGGAALEAQYSPETINLKWYDEGGTRIATNSCTYDNGITLPSNPIRTGYTFKGWRAIPGTRIEYIESTGTQYIDTGIPVNDHNSFEMRVAVTEPVDGVWYILSQGFNSVRIYPEYQIFWFSANYNFSFSYEKLRFYTLHFGYNYMNVDDATVIQTPDTDYAEGTTVTIFATNDFRQQFGHSKARIAYLKIWDSNHTLVRDMIPVKDINGVACMYDKVSGQFFYNQGTGNFIAGPEI